MTDFLSSVGASGGVIGGFLSFQASKQQARHIKQAGALQAQGDLLNAAGFRASAEALEKITLFNLQIQQKNELQQLQGISRQYQRTIGNNLSATAASGINIHSKSALMIQSEVADSFEKVLLNTKLNFENQRRAAQFESEVRQTTLENQARVSEFQAQADRVLAANRAADIKAAGKISLISGILSSASLFAGIV